MYGKLDELNPRKQQPVIGKQKAKRLPYLRRDGELVWVHVAFHEGKRFSKNEEGPA